MSIKVAILASNPTSYWPLDDLVGSRCHDEASLHDASVPAQGVSLAVIPFGESQAPYFDGELGSYLTIDSDPKYSHAYANALTVAAWICPLTLDNAQTAGKADQFIHFVEKAVSPSVDVEWVLRLYNQTNPNRHSRLSFYTFNLGSHAGEGNGSYMEYGVSANDETPIELGKWVFVVGQAEPWISATDRTKGCILGSKPSRRSGYLPINMPILMCVLKTGRVLSPSAGRKRHVTRGRSRISLFGIGCFP